MGYQSFVNVYENDFFRTTTMTPSTYAEVNSLEALMTGSEVVPYADAIYVGPHARICADQSCPLGTICCGRNTPKLAQTGGRPYRAYPPARWHVLRHNCPAIACRPLLNIAIAGVGPRPTQ